MTKFTMLVFAPLLLSAVGSCAGQSPSRLPDESGSITVMCNSTVGHDTGFCQVKANETCGRKARLIGIISNIEMTRQTTGQLYTITARYQCSAA